MAERMLSESELLRKSIEIMVDLAPSDATSDNYQEEYLRGQAELLAHLLEAPALKEDLTHIVLERWLVEQKIKNMSRSLWS